MFNYDDAFSRNLGWTTDWEQASLRARRVAIAGLGGVGGGHLLALTRLGVGAFNLAEFDTFDIVNFNRQAGANIASIGRPKLDVMVEMARAINPDLRITQFPKGLEDATIDAFLSGCDLFVDGLDFFVLPIRIRVFERARALGIPAFTAAPIGMGVGFVAFDPKGQSFEAYFRLAGQPEPEQYLRFLMGVAPAGLHRAYLADDTRVDLAGKRGPSTGAACELCAGMVATQALKVLLGRGGVPFAPEHLTMDAYRGRMVRTRLRWGNAGPLQRLKLAVARRVFGAVAARAPRVAPPKPAQTVMYAILDAARWAPSGDNVQPWRFEVRGEAAVHIHVAREDAANPYDYRNGEPTWLAAGMLLESLAIAASAHGRTASWSLLSHEPCVIEMTLAEAPALPVDPLLAFLPLRSVDRTSWQSRRLTAQDKRALEAELGDGLVVTWDETPAARLAWGRLGALATDIRLRARETFEVHRRIVDWVHPRSPDGLPSGAIGLNRPTLRLMQWSMRSWSRADRVNRLIGTSGAALQLDLLPALCSSAFFSVRVRPEEPASLRLSLEQGGRLQRFWLRATQLGLAVQPALAVLMLAEHGARGTPFTADATLRAKAAALSVRLSREQGDVARLIFLGRIGQRRPGLPGPRSVRRPLSELLLAAADDAPGHLPEFLPDDVPANQPRDHAQAAD